jgi:hypothetical protein
MVYNEDSLEKWKKSRIKDSDGEPMGIYEYVNEALETIDEIKKEASFKDIISGISYCVASGRKPRPSSYIWIILEKRIEEIPITINGFDVEFLFKDEISEENTIYL